MSAMLALTKGEMNFREQKKQNPHGYCFLQKILQCNNFVSLIMHSLKVMCNYADGNRPCDDVKWVTHEQQPKKTKAFLFALLEGFYNLCYPLFLAAVAKRIIVHETPEENGRKGVLVV